MTITKKLLVAAAGATAAIGLAIPAQAALADSNNGEGPGGMGLHMGMGKNDAKAKEHRDQMQKFTAEILGMTTDQLKAAHDDGKKLPDLVKEKGMTMDQFQAKMLEKLQAQWKADGLSQDQIDKRTKHFQDRAEHRELHRQHMHDN